MFSSRYIDFSTRSAPAVDKARMYIYLIDYLNYRFSVMKIASICPLIALDVDRSALLDVRKHILYFER